MSEEIDESNLDSAAKFESPLQASKTAVSDSPIQQTALNSCTENKPGLAARRAAQLPKLRDLNRRLKRDSLDVITPYSAMAPGAPSEIDFVYTDADSLLSELSELYSYSESEEMIVDSVAFLSRTKAQSTENGYFWTLASPQIRRNFLYSLNEDLELTESAKRKSALQCIAYLIQGNFMECDSEHVLLSWIVHNAYKLYEYGVWASLLSVLLVECDSTPPSLPNTSKSSQNSNLSMNDCAIMRKVINCLYTILEVMRREELCSFSVHEKLNDEEIERRKMLRACFLEELGFPLTVGGFGSSLCKERSASGSNTLAALLFDAVAQYCTSIGPHFPIKKILLLLWKTVLAWLGDFEKLKEKKNGIRNRHNLPPCDDTVSVTSSMEPVSVPWGVTVSGALCEFTGRSGEPAPRRERFLLAKRQLACMAVDEEFKKSSETDDEGFEDVPEGLTNQQQLCASSSDQSPPTPRPDSPQPFEPPTPLAPEDSPIKPPPPNKTLPWALKVRRQDVEAFLDRERAKYFRFQVPNDQTTLAGLPRPILDSLDTLNRHIYVSLADKQIERENLLNKYPFSHVDSEWDINEPAENLYCSILPHMAQYVIGLLKILLAGAPTSKPKTDSINLLVEIFTPASLEQMSVSASSIDYNSELSAVPKKLTLEINRHKEILVKAISALILLLLKHFKLNHVFQFEYMSQHLVFANCIPLILKFFDQNVLLYVQSESEGATYAFPASVLQYAQRGTLDYIDAQSFDENEKASEDQNAPAPCPTNRNTYLWRNMFAAVNLLRILNKLTKWKHARTMMLVVFKSAPVLKRSLRVKHILIQLYALKLLKMQAKYLGRQWRKTNMELMSAIYNKVRHRLNDNWAYGNETQAKPWDFQLEEASLREAVEKFNMRRYKDVLKSPGLSSAVGMSTSITASPSDESEMEDFRPLDCYAVSVLGAHVQLSDRFKTNYQAWLRREVYCTPIDWDRLLDGEKQTEKQRLVKQ